MKAMMEIVLVGLTLTFGVGCDGALQPEPGRVTAALSSPGGTSDDVIVDGRIITGESSKEVKPTRSAIGSYVVASGDEVVVINDLAVEGDGPGVVRDCSASATACKASCTLTGTGTCTSTSHSATCTLTYHCGDDNLCETEHTVSCVD